jgi:hypothetical protein
VIAAQPVAPGGLTYDRLIKSGAEPASWPICWGNYQATHYSPLAQINTANAPRLRPPGPFR